MSGWLGNRLALLHQVKVWIPRENYSVKIEDMDYDHVANMIPWMEKNADRWFAEFFDLAPNQRRRYISDEVLVAVSPVEWIVNTPLYKAFQEELAYRKEVNEEIQLLEDLQAACDEVEILYRFAVKRNLLEDGVSFPTTPSPMRPWPRVWTPTRDEWSECTSRCKGSTKMSPP